MNTLITCMYTSSYLYGVGPLLQGFSHHPSLAREREGELKLTNSEVELWNEIGLPQNTKSRVFTSPLHLVKQDIGTRTAC